MSLAMESRATSTGWLAKQFGSFIDLLPRGNSLPANVWLSRHRAILWLIWLQALALILYAILRGYNLPYSLLQGVTVIFAPAITEVLHVRNQTFRSTAASFGLITSSAVLTRLSGGYIEAHFHFFVMLAVIALYQAWMPFLVSVLYVLIHHGVGGILEPTAVFNHPDAIAHPWKWAGIHASFVAAACAAYLVAWRWNEIAQSQTQNILNAAGEGIIGLDAAGKILFMNPAAEAIAGEKATELLDRPLNGLINVTPTKAGVQSPSSLADISPGEATEAVFHRSSSDLPVDIVRTAIFDRTRITGEVVTVRDISSRKQAEKALRESEQRFRSLVQNASDLITVMDADTTVRYQSPSIQKVLGYEPDELIGRKLLDLLHPEDATEILAFLTEAIARPNRSATVEARVKHQDGGWRDLEIIGSDQRLDPAVGGFVLNIRDVSERTALEKQLRHQAFYDSLTDLANRASFFDRIEHALLKATDHRSMLALLYLDLDEFKSVNDRFGHEAGDQLLMEVARRLRQCIRASDTAARLGGDEFAILLEDIADEGYARVICDKLLEGLHLPYVLQGKEFTIDASIGIAITPGEGANASNLLRNADIAMYEAKRTGGGRYAEYSPEMHAAALERLELLADLQHALSRNEFEVFYQPTVSLGSSQIVGFEALIRWHHPQRGLLFPDSFIRLAEESAAIRPIGHWILVEACRQAQEWNAAFPSHAPMTMSVNVSVKQLQHPDFAGEVAEALATSGLAPSALILEVTESVMMQNTSVMMTRLNELKSLGVRLAIDDFGTGYSSLSYLPQFPFDVLKIDKAFIEMDREPSRREITRTIIELAKTLHFDIVAEGIERVEQLIALQSLECEFGQGYYFSRPVSQQEITRLLTVGAGNLEAA